MLASRVAQRQALSCARPAAPLRAASLRVVCKAQSQQEQPLLKRVAQSAVALPLFLAAHPAFALVDDRLNGDGTGKPLGVNAPVLGWVLFGVFSAIWFLWYNSQKDLGDFEDKDAGLKL